MSFYLLDYFYIFILFLASIILSFIILGLSYFFSIQNPEAEKISAYECGFDPYEDSRNKFEIRFYLIAILFIIFDLESMFLFPWVITLHQINFFGYWVMVDFFIELLIGFLYVWVIGGLEWE